MLNCIISENKLKTKTLTTITTTMLVVNQNSLRVK